jgi:serine/threonine-protein kinase
MPVDLAPDDVVQLFPDVSVDGDQREGGQKLVFPVIYAGSRLALKFIDAGPIPADPYSQAEADESLERALREVYVLGRISSPHLVRCGVIQPTLKQAPRHRTRQLFCYSEEWIDGDNLREVLLRDGAPRTLDPDEVIKLGLDILEALVALEQIEIVHRDIKPENIIKRHTSSDFVLIDLGICYDKNSSSLTPASASSPVSPGYASPEQLNHDANRDLELDSRSDLFCLGIVLYEALFGCHPFRMRGDSRQQWTRRILEDAPIQPSERPGERGTIPAKLNAVVMKLLGKYTYLRFRTCEEARQALQQTGGEYNDD